MLFKKVITRFLDVNNSEKPIETSVTKFLGFVIMKSQKFELDKNEDGSYQKVNFN